MAEKKKVDVLIIGGSLAGSACARQLQAAGIDALAFDRDCFPREKVCGSFLSPAAVGALDRLQLLDEVRQAGAVPIRKARVRAFGADFTIPFRPFGLGISRRTLDHLLAESAGVRRGTVTHVHPYGDGFRIGFADESEFTCRAVVDAAGKLSRFTRRIAAGEFGVHSDEIGETTDGIDFWFFEDAYGGTISVEGNRRNICYLVRKPALQMWLEKREWNVTGPLAYTRIPGPYISIGDAIGMVDPFCGDGMGHALESGALAAAVITRGLHSGWDYQRTRQAYDGEWSRRWSGKRRISTLVRAAIQSRRIAPPAFRLAGAMPQLAEAFLRKVWAA